MADPEAEAALVTYCLNSFTIGLPKGDARSLDYSACRVNVGVGV